MQGGWLARVVWCGVRQRDRLLVRGVGLEVRDKVLEIKGLAKKGV